MKHIAYFMFKSGLNTHIEHVNNMAQVSHMEPEGILKKVISSGSIQHFTVGHLFFMVQF